MCAQPKTLKRRVALAALPVIALLPLVGCASGGGSQARRDIPHWESLPASQRQIERAGLMTHSGDSEAVIFAPGAEADPAWYTYQRQIAPEYDRRDGALAAGVPDPTAGWYNFPQPARPTLEDRDFFRTSRSPNTFTFPGFDPGHGYRSWHGYRSHRSSPYPRRRVR